MSHRTILRRARFALILALSLLGTGAQAAPASNETRAHELFWKGREAMEYHRIPEAYQTLREAWTLHHSYDIAGLLGQCELELKKYRDAAEHLEYSLRTFPPKEDRARRSRVEANFTQAKKHVVEVEIAVNKSGAEISIDGQVIGTAPLAAPAFVDAGSHSVEAKLEGYEVARSTVNGTDGTKQTVTLALNTTTGASSSSSVALAPTTAPTVSSSAATASGSGEDTHATRNAVVITGAGLTLVAAAIGVIYWRKAAGADSDAKSLNDQAVAAYGRNGCATSGGAGSSFCVEMDSKLSDRNSANKIQTVAWIGTGVLAAGTVAALVFWPKGAKKEPSVGVVPYFSGGSGGLYVDGRF